MKRYPLVFAAFLALATQVHAQETVPLCAAPLDPDCVDPRWGQVDPDTLDSASGGAATAHAATVAAPASIRMLATSADATGSAHTHSSIKAVVDASKKFGQQTSALVTAIKRVRFDREGNVVKGADELAAAAAAARDAAKGYELTLYIKTPGKLKPNSSADLTKKVRALNGTLTSMQGR